MESLGLFISAPISLDSFNFAEQLKGSKWTDVDVEIFSKLKEINSQLNEDPGSYWKVLNDAKYDQNLNLDLGCHANLIKDYKTYQILPAEPKGFGAATVFLPIDAMINKYVLENVVATIQ